MKIDRWGVSGVVLSDKLRGYWGTVLAVVGLVALLTFSYQIGQNQERNRNQQRATIASRSLIAEKNTAEQYRSACDQPTSWDRASVCAAISSAQSANLAVVGARDDARWNRLGVLAGIMTLIAAIAAAWYASIAAIETRRNAAAAENAIVFAQSIGEKQARAYLSFTKIEAHWAANTVYIKPILRNSGHSPARKINVAVYINHTMLPLEIQAPTMPHDFGGMYIGAGIEYDQIAAFGADINEETAQAIYNKHPIGVTCVVGYKDVFERSYIIRCRCMAMRPHQETSVLHILEHDEQAI